MKVLVSGGTGFIGKYLVRSLIDQGVNCRLLVRSTSNVGELESEERVELWIGDLADRKSLNGIAKDVGYVYHLAAEGHVSAISEEAHSKFVMVNVEGTKNLLEECGKFNVKKFVHFSSTAAMGLIKKSLVSEVDTPEPRTPYQRSKLQSEEAALSHGKRLGVPVVVIRPCMVYGVGGKGEFYRICRLMKKGVFPKVGLGRNLTPLVHVKDVVRGALLAAEKGRSGEVYLIASERSISESELRGLVREGWGGRSIYPYVPVSIMYMIAFMFEMYSKITGRPPIATRSNIANTVWDREFSIEKAGRELGYSQRVPFREGVLETVEWFRKCEN